MNAPSDSLSLPSLTQEGRGHGRRASWGGQDDLATPENPSDSPLATRRSLVSIFGSLGKAGRKQVTSREAHRKKVTNTANSQFYVDLPQASPSPASPAPSTPLPSFSLSQPSDQVVSTPTDSCRQQKEEKRDCVIPHASSPHRVLVIPEAAREALAYQQRARRLAGETSPRPQPETTGSMGMMVSAEQSLGPTGYGVEVCVAQRYGSVLAELTKRRNSPSSHHNPVMAHPSLFAHILPRHLSPSLDQRPDQRNGIQASVNMGQDTRRLAVVRREDTDIQIISGSTVVCSDITQDTARNCGRETEITKESSEGECSGEDEGDYVDGGIGENDDGENEGEGDDSGSSTCDPTNQSETANSALTNNRECSSSRSMVLGVACDTNTCLSDVTPGPSPELTSQEKRDRKVFLIAQEIMTSEQMFVDVLKLLNIDFRKYVMEGGVTEGQEGGEDPYPALPTKDLDRILNYLPQLQNLNEEILSDLQQSIAGWEGRKKISDVIVRKGPFLKLYSDYIREFQSQCDHLDHCCILYPAFARAVKQFEASERCTRLGVKHYMLKPVQRIPQYRLLLEQYLRTLHPDSPDHLDTQHALVVVSNVASHANDTLKQGTNFMKLLALQDRLSSSSSSSSSTSSSDQHDGTSSRGPRYELVRPGRYLLKEGELLKLCRREMQPRYFILLSDVLLYTSQVTGGQGGALRLNYELTLEGMRVDVPQAEDFKNEFSVISTSRSFTLQASSAEERDEWLTALREAIADNAFRRSSFMQVKMTDYPMPISSTLGKQAPVWIPDYRVTMCQQCTAAFTLTFRRHHCRACGKVVCDHCSANRAPLQYKGNQVARVCDSCFEVLQRDFQTKCEEAEGGRVAGQGGAGQTDNLRAQFKRGVKESSRKQTRKKVPDRLMEVCASDATSQMRGYLRVLLRRSWRRGWFVLKDRVLYEYRAPQDVKALYSLPVLGYLVLPMDKQVKVVTEDLDNCLAFQLSHPNQEPLLFQADSPHLAEKWIQAMKEAVVLT